jgi:oligoendopeptidase F
MAVTKESLGDSFVYSSEYKNYWSYIPHFIHSPFYVYAYAFGDGLVNALFAIYETGKSNFENNYIEMLSAGGSKHHSDLLKPFGLSALDPNFWENGLKIISNLIDQLETLED